MSDLKKLARDYHRKLRGKIKIELKQKLRGKKDLALAYTPGVAKPCLEIAKNPEKAYEYCWKQNTILIVTDGTAVLGLGDIGPEAALPVMEGKSLLFKEFGGVDCVPICLDTKDPQEIVEIVSGKGAGQSQPQPEGALVPAAKGDVDGDADGADALTLVVQALVAVLDGERITGAGRYAGQHDGHEDRNDQDSGQDG